MNESEAIRASQAGDRQAFAGLIERHYKSVYRLAYYYTGNHHDADDVCQETFLRAMRNIGGLRDSNGFAGWIFVIASNLLRRGMRSRRRRRLESRSGPEAPSLESSDIPRDPLVQQEWAAAMRRELERMPQKARLAAILVLMEGLRQKEAARIMGCSEASVSRHLDSARHLLRAGLRRFIE